MKFLTLLCVVLVSAMVSAQTTTPPPPPPPPTPSPETIRDNLLRGQSELSITHEFVEILLAQSREQLSSEINDMTQQLIDSFMDNYGEIKDVADETRNVFPTLVPGRCLDAALRRFNLQVERHGSVLSNCLLTASNILTDYNVQLNAIHSTAHRTTNQVQNSGLHTLSQMDGVVARVDYERLINRQLRILLTLARPYQLRFDSYVDNIASIKSQILEELTACDRRVTASFIREANYDLVRARNCAADV